jgi:hypothetical protein
MNRSKITTQEAEALLRDGCVLKTHKSRRMLQSYCVVNARGRAWYINKDVFETLRKHGFRETPNDKAPISE